MLFTDIILSFTLKTIMMIIKIKNEPKESIGHGYYIMVTIHFSSEIHVSRINCRYSDDRRTVGTSQIIKKNIYLKKSLNGSIFFNPHLNLLDYRIYYINMYSTGHLIINLRYYF